MYFSYPASFALFTSALSLWILPLRLSIALSYFNLHIFCSSVHPSHPAQQFPQLPSLGTIFAGRLNASFPLCVLSTWFIIHLSIHLHLSFPLAAGILPQRGAREASFLQLQWHQCIIYGGRLHKEVVTLAYVIYSKSGRGRHHCLHCNTVAMTARCSLYLEAPVLPSCLLETVCLANKQATFIHTASFTDTSYNVLYSQRN